MWRPNLSESGEPIYRAIVDALEDDLERGTLAPGERLPTHRGLADALEVTVGTVSRAYAEATRRGLVDGQVGRGTFVRERHALEETWFDDVPAASEATDLSVNHPVRLPSEERGRLASTLEELSGRGDLERMLAYQPERGMARHREAGAAWMGRLGLEVDSDDVLVVGGGQHAIASVFTALLRPGDRVLAGALSYPGVKIVAALTGVRLEPLPQDDEGILPDAFDQACASAPVRALYCVPTIHNPTTGTMSEARREEIARLARAHDVVVLEDDAHGGLPSRPVTPIAAFAPDHTVHVAGLSKCLAAGLRIGYVRATGEQARRLIAGIRATTLMATPLTAEIATRWIETGTAVDLLERKRAEAVARQALVRDVLADRAVRAHPEGIHAWLTLPEGRRASDFVRQAARRGVLVTGPEPFTIPPAPSPEAVRISVGGVVDRDELERALAVLDDLLDQPPGPGWPVV